METPEQQRQSAAARPWQQERFANGQRPVQVIAVASGKGGVGKTNICVNLGIALAERGRRVLLLDADLGLGNVDVLVGAKPQATLADVLDGKAALGDIVLDGPGGIRMIPAASGVPRLANLSLLEHAALINGFSELGDRLDVMVIDTATGISPTTTSFLRASQEVLIVVCDEPASIADAYALVKAMSVEHGVFHFRVVPNLCRSVRDGQKLYEKFHALCDRALDVMLDYAGYIPYDESVRSAVQKQKPVLEYAPRCRASRAIRLLAQAADEWPLRTAASGHLEFFVEQLVSGGPAQARA